jgi:Cu2+-exporting ATPase/Cu+-exporting ATPase
MVGTGRGATDGILIKSAEAIEIAHAVDTVVLDKTGTVTEGKPVVTDVAPVDGIKEETLLAVAASLEKLSEHPLGEAVVQEASRRGLACEKVDAFTRIPGLGISGVIGNRRHFAGNSKLLASQEITLDAVWKSKSDTFAGDGKTVLYFICGHELLGMIAVADKVKKTSPQTVAELQKMGIDVIMLTGDNAVTAAAVQKQTGIRRVLAEVLPQDKEREVRALREQGRKVAVVGDGINDAPALAQADVGIAVGAGTDIAIESADIVLMKSDLLDAVTVIQLSRAVMRTIRQNLFWAFFYNCVSIPVAAGVFYTVWGLTLSPMIAAAAMSLSSVSVVSNALRLRFFTPEHAQAEEGTCSFPLSSIPAAMIQHTIRSCTMKKSIRIEGMSCGHCTSAVAKALRAVPGVEDVNVDLASKTAAVETNSGVPNEVLKKVVADTGFKVISIQ